jgi:hypothetical protein
MAPFFVLLLNCWWFWRALPAAISAFVKSLRCTDHYPIKIGDKQERLVAASPLMSKNWGSGWGKQLRGERPRESAET